MTIEEGKLIDNILMKFDFDKVYKAIILFSDGNAYPTIEDIKQEAKELLEHIVNHKELEGCSGHFFARQKITDVFVLSLYYELEGKWSWMTV